MLSTRHEKHAIARSEVATILASLLATPQPAQSQLRLAPARVTVRASKLSSGH